MAKIEMSENKYGNATVLRRVVDTILLNAETDPESFEMSGWGGKTSAAKCGTYACFAGWANWLGNVEGYIPNSACKFNKAGTKINALRNPWYAATMEYLGITSTEDRLFHVASWPKKFQSGDPKDMLRARVEHFIKTGE